MITPMPISVILGRAPNIQDYFKLTALLRTAGCAFWLRICQENMVIVRLTAVHFLILMRLIYMPNEV